MSTVYKDFYFVDSAGQPQKWVRYDLESIEKAIENLGDNHQGLFTSIQSYEAPKQVENESYDCDFVCDFDGEDALDDARKLVNHLISLDIVPLVYFSGSKGFHVISARQSWGALTNYDLNKQFKALAWKLKKELILTTLDLSLYAKRKQLRIENTLHGKSKLYKVPLTINELSLPLDKIKELAKQKRKLDQYLNRVVSNKAKQLFDLALSFIERDEPEFIEPKEIKFEKVPPCIEAILKEGVFELHTINSTMFRLVAYFKSQDVPITECVTLINEWLKNIKPEFCMDLTPDGQVDIKHLESQAKSTIRSVYNNINYGFSCGGIKAVVGEKFCTEKCKTVVEEKIYVNLFAASKAEYLGKRIYVEAEAIGRQDKVYAIPREIVVRCDPSGTDKCINCPLISNCSGLRVHINARTPNVLDFIQMGLKQMASKLTYALPGLPDPRVCPKWSYQVVSDQNVEVIYIAPVVTNEFSAEDKYVREKVYMFGHGLNPNESYEFSGYSHISRSSLVEFCFDSAIPLVDSLNNFVQTPEMIANSKIFCKGYGQTLQEKHNQIVASLAYNHIHVWGREMLIKAVDLTYHSVRQFNFQRELVNGWLDVLVIGDTGQAKSTIVEKLMRHYQLGVRVTGEAAGRTGLLYTIPLNDQERFYIVWGVIPRHTGRLVMIDEFKKLIENGEMGEFKDVRSKGELDVQKSAFGKAKSQTRLIWVTNMVDRKSMRNYGYPVMAISELMGATADVRRFTLAVGVTSNQVSDEIINQDIDKMTPVADLYTSDICQHHLLWVWNLNPEDIIIEKKIERRILALSVYMCKTYVATIQLVEPGDFRLKLARVACAVAARMNSRSGDKLVVTDECVDYAYEFINGLYKDKSLKFYQYSMAYADTALSDKELVKLVDVFKSQWTFIWEDLGKSLMINQYIKAKEIAVLVKSDEKELKEVFIWMASYKLLESGKGYYYKSQIGIKFLETLVPESNDGIKSASEVLADTNLEGDDF